MQDLIDKVDMDGSGAVRLHELQKMVRMRHAQVIQTVRKLFAQCEALERKPCGECNIPTGVIPVEAARHALESISNNGIARGSIAGDEQLMGPSMPTLEVADADVNGYVDLQTFVRCAQRRLKAMQKVRQANMGYSPTEVDSMRATFKSYDKDSSGELRNDEVVKLIEKTFPRIAHEVAMRPKLFKIMADIDTDGDGRVDFSEFLALMRHAQELDDQERLDKLRTAIQDTGYNREEIAQFRDLFMAADLDRDDRLSQQEVRDMIDHVMPLNDGEKGEFGQLFSRYNTMKIGDMLDFPDFMRFMRKLLDMDFARITTRTRIIVNRQTSRVGTAARAQP